ncbi:TPA: hypothetical protein QIE17_003577 [Morganella morganii subsp. morganii]|nr:hypothetical protein [Morganella morganii subsp. morganii]
MVSYFHVSSDKFFRDRRDDGIPVSFYFPHSGGNPISQRECSGFNWPPLSIPAEQPVSISPVAFSRTGKAIFDCWAKLLPVIPGVIPVPPRFPSDALGVVHPASCAAV